MAESLRALISCAHAWPLMDKHSAALAAAGIEYDIPAVAGQQLEEADLIPIIGDYDGILAGDDILNAAVLSHASRLRVISKWGIGVDAIDIPYAEGHGITVTNTPGVFAHELADYALGYLLLLARRQHEIDREVHGGRWHKVRGASLQDRTIGLLGLGSSGRQFARRLAVMGLRVLATEPYPPDPAFLAETGTELVSFEELLARSEIISLHAPATPETRHIIGADAFAAMRPGTWLINIARGSLVDEEALVSALENGTLAAAALDVFEREPIAADHPLLGHPNVILGSHNGSNTQEAAERTTSAAMANLISGLVTP